LTVRVPDAPLVPIVAVTTTAFVADTPLVTAAKPCETLPAATATFAGTVTEGSALLRVTMTPPVGAGALRLIVPAELAPPVTDEGLKLREVSEREEFTVNVAIAVVVPVVATTITTRELFTDPAAIEKDISVAPAGTSTLVGTGTAVELLLNATGNPPAGAGAFSVTAPVDTWPTATIAGLNVRLATTGGSSVNLAVLLDVPNPAPIVAVRGCATAVVATLKVVPVVPPGTVTLAGTRA
jgi:hypothetical protein